jgi:hypothetical protein
MNKEIIELWANSYQQILLITHDQMPKKKKALKGRVLFRVHQEEANKHFQKLRTQAGSLFSWGNPVAEALP